MTPEEITYITKHKDELVLHTYLKVEEIISELNTNYVLTDEEKDILISYKIPYERCSELYSVMQIKVDGFGWLVKALIITNLKKAAAILKRFLLTDEASSVTVQHSQDQHLLSSLALNNLNSEANLMKIVNKLGEDFVFNYLQSSGLESGGLHEKYITGLENQNIWSCKCSSNFICFQIYNNRILSGHTDGKIRIWDMKTLQCTNTLEGEGKCLVSDLQCNEDIVLCATLRQLLIWEIDKNELAKRFDHQNDVFRNLRLIKENLVALGQSGRVYIINLQNYNEKNVVSKIDDSHKVHVMYAGDDFVFTSSWKEKPPTIKVWNINTLNLVKTLRANHGHENVVLCMYYFNSKFISADKMYIRYWCLDIGECKEIRIVGAPISCLTFNKFFIVSGHEDGTVKILSMKQLWNSDQSFKTLAIGDSAITSISINEDTIAVLLFDRMICFSLNFE